MATDFLIQPVAFAVQVAVSAALVAVVAILIFVAHPRRWWTNRSFDVDGYIEDDLLVRLTADVEAIVAASKAGPRARTGATVVVGADSSVTFKPGKDQVPCLSLAGFINKTFGTAASIKSGTEFTADQLGKNFIDMADVASVQNANQGDPVAGLIADCWAMSGTPVADYVMTTPGFALCFSIDRASLSGLRAGISNPDLAALFSTASDADPGVALIAECVAQPSDAEAWAALRNELDPVLAAIGAIAEIRHFCSFVFPQLKVMRFDRRTDLKLTDVFKMFNAPYLHEFMQNYHEAIIDYESTSAAMWTLSKNLVADLKNTVHQNITGKKPEHFRAASETPVPVTKPYSRRTDFGVFVGPDGKEHFVEEFNPLKLLKSGAKVLDMIPKILEMIPELITAVMDILKALVGLMKELAQDPLKFLVDLLKLVVNVVVLVAVILLEPAMAAVVWVVLAVVPLAIKLAFFAAILLVACAFNLVLAFADMATGGALRFLALSEDHPETWYLLSGAHSGNGTARIFGTFYPCAAGYSCGTVPVYCSRVSRCEPLASPAAMLAYNLRYNRLRPVASVGRLFAHPLFPSDSVACTRAAKRYALQSTRAPSVNGFTLDVGVLQELLVASCCARMKSADSTQDVCQMCSAAVTGTHKAAVSASGTPVDVRKAAQGMVLQMSGSRKAIVSVCAVLAIVAVVVRAKGLTTILRTVPPNCL